MSWTYESLEAFYDEPVFGPPRKASGEVDYGWWAEPAPVGPGHDVSTATDARLSYVEATGEVYVFRARPYGRRPRVEVVGDAVTRGALDELLAGWEHQAASIVGPGLQWALDRLTTTLGSEAV